MGIYIPTNIFNYINGKPKTYTHVDKQTLINVRTLTNI